MLASHLRSSGYSVLEASDGDQAWELAHEHLPHLVILDVMMPGMSGWEVCRKIREAVSLAHTGVIMLTGIGESLNEMTSPLYGADAYVDKPFEFAILDTRIKETLERRKQGALGRPDGGAEEASMAIEAGDLPAASSGGKKLKAAAPKREIPKPLAKTKPRAEPKAKTAPRKAEEKPSKKAPAVAKPAALAVKASKKPAAAPKAPVKAGASKKAPVKTPSAKSVLAKPATSAKAAATKRVGTPAKTSTKKAPVSKPIKAPAKKAPTPKKAPARSKAPQTKPMASKKAVAAPAKKSQGAKKPGSKK
jgi:CheY-like chemotaxis protein